jgi:hypothetical protein
MRPVPLTVLQGGINRLRVKGGASAARLYDLQNAYITNAGSIAPREGTIRAATLDGNTVGLCTLNGVFQVFSSTLASVPQGYIDNLLINPVNSALAVTKIWFAKPFMGFLYVVAQFSDGSIFHYWLQNNGNWAASTVYKTGTVILPLTTQTGLAYLATRDLAPNPTWAPETLTAVNAIVEPTSYTGFAYQATAVVGTNPHTGQVEPVWPILENGTIQEFGDFSTSSTDAGTTQGTTTTASNALGQTITDRYGNSSTIANAGTSAGAAVVPVTAATIVTTWSAGTLYSPGAVVRPTNNQGAFINAIPNGDFEAGNDGNWVSSGTTPWTFTTSNPYQGTECIQIPTGNMSAGGDYMTMNTYGLVTPGQSVTASAYLNPNNNGADLNLWVSLRWYDSGDTFLSETVSAVQQGGGYRKTTVTGVAPASAAHVRAAIKAGSGTNSRNTAYADLVIWSLETPASVSNFLFEAVQSVPASSATHEPTWPTVAGSTVIDGGVTWQAIGTSIITWKAIPIMKSGSGEPTWPLTVGGAVKDGNMSWTATDRHIADINDPNTKVVALMASHIFAGNKDIVSYSAAVNPTDWTSTNNAGYLPTGLNNYGDNPVAMLALYRSNLMVFNAGGYQMWQVDPDPANMALLDAQPVGSTYTRSAQSVANDLLFLTVVGVRNLGTAGATANMQLGSTGQPVDPLVVAQIKAGTYDPISLYYPGRGQYWLIFGPQAFVMTINGTGQKSWSRYIFPDSITDWTLNGETLYLRSAGNLIWQVDAGTATDDSYTIDPSTLLLLHFDGLNGQTTTTDSSSYGHATLINASFASLSSTTPKFGPSSLLVANANIYTHYTAATPFALGSQLDIFTTAAWTIECWFRLPASGGPEAYPFNYGGPLSTPDFSDFYCLAIDNGNGTTTVSLNDVNMFSVGAGATISTTVTVASGLWHHVAVVRNAGNTTVYLDGVSFGTNATWGAANYVNGNASPNVVIGSMTRRSGTTAAMYVDEFRVSNVARYTANFTPSNQPFSSSGSTPVFTGFKGVIQWPYLDIGPLGINKMMVGVDLVGDGDVSIQIGFDQSDKTTFVDNAGFATSLGVTAPYDVPISDTVPGEPLPIPINAPSYSLILTFAANQAWTWEAANIYLSDLSGGGATG